ncbi:glycosyltransferase family 2 protein [Sorangium sp. So ce295]|jgi:glycosyltransferase involved in cell wall biosynthesis|uniref:glycosyltransferase family 2 protein n=1 Tax=Sorangium sp. So ce295 TaxID=3133295 RepID=UPI003F63B38A
MYQHADSRRGKLIEFSQLSEQPFCTVIIPCYNEEHYIESTLRSVRAQRYPGDRIEILVVDGGSIDATREIVARISAEDPRVILLDNPRRIQSAAMNIGISRSRGDVIIRMDAHAEYAEDYVMASVDALRRTGAANAGGAARPRSRNNFQRVLCTVLSSPLGVGGSAYRDASREGFVESVFNGAFRREVFDVVGLYDTNAVTNEDAELNQRIIEAGGKIYLSRDIQVYYYPRSSLSEFTRQYFAYGKGRARTLLIHRRLLSMRPLVPFLTVTSFALLLAGSVVTPLLCPLLAAQATVYAVIVLVESGRAARRGALRDLPLLCAIFPIMHFAHGLGVWAGLIQHARTVGLEPREHQPAR